MLGYKIYEQASDVFLNDCIRVFNGPDSSISALNQLMDKHWFCFNESSILKVRLETGNESTAKLKKIMSLMSEARPKFLKTEDSRKEASKVINLLFDSIWLKTDKTSRIELLQIYLLASKNLKRTKHAASLALNFLDGISANKLANPEIEFIEFLEANLSEYDLVKLKKILKSKNTLVIENDNINVVFKGKVSFISANDLNLENVIKKLIEQNVNYFFYKGGKSMKMFDLTADPIQPLYLTPQEGRTLKLFIRKRKISTTKAAKFFSGLSSAEENQIKKQFSKTVFKINDYCVSDEKSKQKIILSANKSRAFYQLNPTLKIAFQESKA